MGHAVTARIRFYRMVAGASRVVHLQRDTDGNRTACGAVMDVSILEIMPDPRDGWVNCVRCNRTYAMRRAEVEGFIYEGPSTPR